LWRLLPGSGEEENMLSFIAMNSIAATATDMNIRKSFFIPMGRSPFKWYTFIILTTQQLFKFPSIRGINAEIQLDNIFSFQQPDIIVFLLFGRC
jgi:hypothetical protein